MSGGGLKIIGNGLVMLNDLKMRIYIGKLHLNMIGMLNTAWGMFELDATHVFSLDPIKDREDVDNKC